MKGASCSIHKTEEKEELKNESAPLEWQLFHQNGSASALLTLEAKEVCVCVCVCVCVHVSKRERESVCVCVCEREREREMRRRKLPSLGSSTFTAAMLGSGAISGCMYM